MDVNEGELLEDAANEEDRNNAGGGDADAVDDVFVRNSAAAAAKCGS